jgi:parallel beta-helix repeat protein
MNKNWLLLIFCFSIFTPLFVNAQNFNEFLKIPIPGRVEGKGTHFEIKDSDYLNIILESEKEIEVVLESIPKMISLNIASSTEATTTLTLKGLEPNKKYFKYEDTHKNETELFPDENGSYSWQQDLTKPHHIWIQEIKGTIYIPENCTLPNGTWETSTQTCTLTQDVTDTIEIDADNITLNCDGHWISGSILSYGIYLSGKKGVNIKNCKINGFDYGIVLNSSQDLKIRTSEIENSYVAGIQILSSSSVEISKTKISNCAYAILAGTIIGAEKRTLENGLIFENELEGNGGGISFLNTFNTKVLKNKISKNNFGISLFNSSSTFISENTILENSYHAIDLVLSTNNTLNGNIILNNGEGILLNGSSNNIIFENTISNQNGQWGRGIYFTGYYTWEGLVKSENNKLYHNNFIQNKVNAKVESDYASGNLFDNGYPSGGNYWSDYTGSDANGDGIGDTPYCFQGGCDDYPFMTENGWQALSLLPKILISEVYYDVDKRKDKGGNEEIEGDNEWVIIHNLENETIDISGWQICDNERCDEIPTSSIPANGFAIITPTSTTFNFWRIPKNMIRIVLGSKFGSRGLANEGDRVILKDKEGNIADAMSYGNDTFVFFPECTKKLKATKGKSLLRDPSYKDTDTCEDFKESEPTIGKNWLPIPVINFSPKNPVKGVKVKFDASLSDDPDGEIINFEWQLGNSTSTGTTTEFTFTENGEYQITLTATDNDGATSSTSTTIKVEPFSFAIITDLHIGRGYPDYDGSGFDDDGYNGEEYYLTQRLRKVVNWINENKDKIQCDNATCSIKFLVVLGDIADSGEKSEFLKAKEILDQLQIPYVPVFGNHDVWPKTDLGNRAEFPLGVNYFEEVFFDENATNTKLLKEKLNLTKEDFQYKNYLFKFGGISFIVLDFITRKDVGKATLHEQTMDWLKEKLNELQGKEPIILFSHHPLTEEGSRELYGFKVVPFYGTNFTGKEIEILSKVFENYENLQDGKQILGAFGGHVHGYYPQEIFVFKIPERNVFFDANWEYPSLSTIPVLTTEALMVGSNREDEYLREVNKGIIRIVKILDNQTINFDEIEGKYDPDSGTGEDFIALNPYISRGYTAPLPNTSSCFFFKAHAFTKRDVSFLWDFGDNTTSSHAWVPLKCYENPGTYNVKLTLKDNKTGEEEFITRIIIAIRKGFVSKTLKLADSTLEKVKIISREFSEDLKEIMKRVGNIALDFQDQILFQFETTHSEKVFVPVANITVHFEKAKGDVDLLNLQIKSDVHIKKVLFYSSQWAEEVENQKILFVPK